MTVPQIFHFKTDIASARLQVWDPLNVMLVGLYVQPEHRREGAATSLMDEICKYADANGYRLGLTVRGYGKPPVPSNDQLIEFYKKFGFEIVEQSDRTKILMKRFEKGKQ